MIKKNIENILFFLTPFTVFIAAAYVLVFKLQFVYGDALSRSFHAYSVFFGNQPKLTAIGFVWPPIPTLVQLPLVLFNPLNNLGFAGNVVSAIFMALTAVYLNKIYKYFNIGFVLRLLFLFMFILNPMILFFGSNGMSEAIAVLFVTTTTYFLVAYLSTRSLSYVLKLGISTSLAVMTRWELAALIPVIMLIIGISVFLNYQKNCFKKIEGTILLFLTPVFFIISIWILANWIIMGDPFYFLTSIYSNTAQSEKLIESDNTFRNMQYNFGKISLFFLQRVILLFPAYLVFCIFAIIKGIKNKEHLLCISLLLPTMSVLLFHAILLYKGQSFGWLRFFIYVLPSAYIFLGYIIANIKKRTYFYITLLCAVIIIVISSVSSLYAMANPKIGREENQLVKATLYSDLSQIEDWSYQKDMHIAQYIKNNTWPKKILVDDFMGFPIVYYTQKPSIFIETIDDNFEEVLLDPVINDEVGYILVHKLGGVGDLDAINRRFPGIFENGTDFTTLEKAFEDWKLYKINK